MPGLCGTLRRWRAEERAGERRRKDPTSLQQACNRLATSLQLWGRSRTATVGVTTQAAGDPGRDDLVAVHLVQALAALVEASGAGGELLQVPGVGEDPAVAQVQDGLLRPFELGFFFLCAGNPLNKNIRFLG